MDLVGLKRWFREKTGGGLAISGPTGRSRPIVQQGRGTYVFGFPDLDLLEAVELNGGRRAVIWRRASGGGLWAIATDGTVVHLDL